MDTTSSGSVYLVNLVRPGSDSLRSKRVCTTTGFVPWRKPSQPAPGRGRASQARMVEGNRRLVRVRSDALDFRSQGISFERFRKWTFRVPWRGGLLGTTCANPTPPPPQPAASQSPLKSFRQSQALPGATPDSWKGSPKVNSPEGMRGNCLLSA